jgi:hypothetical protein
MAQTAPQDFKTHRRWYPLYHFVATPILLLNVIAAVWHAVRIPTTWNIWTGVVSIGLLATVWTARGMALNVQNRVIRLEMQLRLREVLPAALAARIGELRTSQLIGLRFAGNGEMAGLVERCLSGELANGEAVKKQIKHWQPDWLRA